MPEIDFTRRYLHRAPIVSLTVELVVLTVANGRLRVLMVERASEPFNGQWVLPGNDVLNEQLLGEVAREARDELGLHEQTLEEFALFSDPARDRRAWVVSAAYLVPVEPDRLQQVVWSGEDFSLVDVASDANGHVLLSYQGLELSAGFDHADIIASAVRHLRRMLDCSLLGFRFLPHYFTLLDLQEVHETILGRKVDKVLFRKRMLGRVFDYDAQITPSQHSRQGQGAPAKLYSLQRATRP